MQLTGQRYEGRPKAHAAGAAPAERPPGVVSQSPVDLTDVGLLLGKGMLRTFDPHQLWVLDRRPQASQVPIKVGGERNDHEIPGGAHPSENLWIAGDVVAGIFDGVQAPVAAS